MSPNSFLCFNARGELCGYDGEGHKEPVFVWTCEVFQDYVNDAFMPARLRALFGAVAPPEIDRWTPFCGACRFLA